MSPENISFRDRYLDILLFSVPRPRGWVDRVAEALLGENEQSPSSKYALICGKCHTHNGLVLKEELGTTQYVCPHCGFFNKAKEGVATTILKSPPSPQPLPDTAQAAAIPLPRSDSFQFPSDKTSASTEDLQQEASEDEADQSNASISEVPRAKKGNPFQQARRRTVRPSDAMETD